MNTVGNCSEQETQEGILTPMQCCTGLELLGVHYSLTGIPPASGAAGTCSDAEADDVIYVFEKRNKLVSHKIIHFQE